MVEGIRTNAPLHRDLVRDRAFAGGVSIHYLESKLEEWAQCSLPSAGAPGPSVTWLQLRRVYPAKSAGSAPAGERRGGGVTMEDNADQPVPGTGVGKPAWGQTGSLACASRYRHASAPPS